MTISDVISNIGVVTTWMLGTVGDVVDTILGEPVLLLTFSLPLALIGISVLKRLFGVRL